jgi:hypothetical protein
MVRRRPRDMVRRRPRDTVKLRPRDTVKPRPRDTVKPRPRDTVKLQPRDMVRLRPRDTAKSRSRDIRVKVTHLTPSHMRSARTDGREARSFRLQPRNSAPGQDSPVEERDSNRRSPLREGCFRSSNASGLGTSRTASAREGRRVRILFPPAASPLRTGALRLVEHQDVRLVARLTWWG